MADSSDTPRPPWRGPAARIARAALTLALLVGSAWIIRTELHHVGLARVSVALHRQHLPVLALALGATALSYLALACYDVIALRILGLKPTERRGLEGGFLSAALGNAVGIPFVTSAAVRLAVYRGQNLTMAQVIAVTTIASFASLAGLALLSGLSLLFVSPAFSLMPLLTPRRAHILGTAILFVLIVFAAGLAIFRRGLHIGDRALPPVKLTHLSALMFVGFADWIGMAATLFLIGPWAAERFTDFVPSFAISSLAGYASALPAGIGVFDAGVMLLAPAEHHNPDTAAALITFRVIYYLLPLAAGIALWLRQGAPEPSRARSGLMSAASQITTEIGPPALALLIFAAGALLVLHAALPIPRRLALDYLTFVPPEMLEASRWLTALLGVAMMLVANGLARRVDTAQAAAIAMLVAGMVLLIVPGRHWLTGALFGLLAVLLVRSRSAFRRHGGLISANIPVQWLGAIAGVVIAIAVLAVRLPHALGGVVSEDTSAWLHQGGAIARALSAGLALALLALIWRLAKPSRAKLALPSAADLDRAAQILADASSSNAGANVALVGDKHLLFSASGKSFLSFGVRGRTWIAMGEPVGPADEIAELTWAFREQCDRVNAVPVFYAVGNDFLPTVVTLGLIAEKIGETAIIDLDQFSLEGSARQKLRHAHRRAGRDGASFEVLSKADVPAHLADLQRVSDDWLAAHQGSEKSFSLGRFDAAYMTRFDQAIVRMGSDIVAFANLWASGDGKKLAVDLMRYSKASPYGVMEFLFTEIALWAQHRGFRTLDLGMAPLAGLAGHRLASLMSRLGGVVYAHGEEAYGFEGLRKFKDRFGPKWEPLYVAAPGRTLAARAIADAALLTSGGVLGALGLKRKPATATPAPAIPQPTNEAASQAHAESATEARQGSA